MKYCLCVLKLPFRLEFVGYIVRRYGQQVFLSRSYSSVEAVVVLIEVKDIGGEEGGFPPDMGERLFYELVNEQPPIHGPDYGHGTKHGVGHV